MVTKAGLWLQPAPEASLELIFDIPEEGDIGWVVETIAPMKISGLIEQNVFIPSWLDKMVLKGRRHDFWDKPGVIPEWRVAKLLKQYKLGYWQVALRLYGEESAIKAKAEIVKAAMKRHLAAPPQENWWRQGDAIGQDEITMGVPSSVPLQMSDWIGGRGAHGAHMGFSPVVPASSEHVLGQLKRSRRIIADHDVDFYASFTIGGRFANNINMLMYDRDDAPMVENMKALFNALISQRDGLPDRDRRLCHGYAGRSQSVGRGAGGHDRRADRVGCGQSQGRLAGGPGFAMERRHPFDGGQPGVPGQCPGPVRGL